MMLSLKGHIQLNEARSRGEEMEEFIIAAVNNSKEPKSKYGIPAGAGKNVAKFLKSKGIECLVDLKGIKVRWFLQ